MSGITSKEDIGYVRTDVAQSRHLAKAVKTLVFKHQAVAGQTVIDLGDLTAPVLSLTNGFVQPTSYELSAANLIANRKNLRLKSSRGVELEQYEDFIVTGNQSILLIGSIAASGGALEGEIFTGYISPVVVTGLTTTDARLKKKTYVLPAGETLLNLGVEYQVGVGLTSGEQVGAIDVILDGVEQFRNVGNAAASPSADGNYQEIDSGNSIGSQIKFNVASSYNRSVIVKFGLVYAGDFSVLGDIEAMMGTLIRLAEDASAEFSYPLSRYLSASPSAVERVEFGDRLSALEVSRVPTGARVGYVGITAPRGWVRANGLTIGNAVSGATERADADTEALFTLLWNEFPDSILPVSGGRGASAAADFAANKTIGLPDYRDRTAIGHGSMGNSAAGRVTNAISGFDSTILGASGGSQSHTLSLAEMPSHNHGGGSHSHTINLISNPQAEDYGGVGAAQFAGSSDISTNASGAIITTQGSGAAHRNMQPSIVDTVLLKL